MSVLRLALLALLVLAVAACSREQPSGIPDLTPATPAPAPAAAPVANADPATPIRDAPPPLNTELEEFNRTGYAVCDDFMEEYRQCLNTHLIADDLRVQGDQWRAVGNSIIGNVARGVAPERIEASCSKARRLAVPRMTALGCTVKP